MNKEQFKKIKLEVEKNFDTDIWQNSLEEFITKIRNSKNTKEDSDFIQEILAYWAEHIGCAEDGELAETMISDLCKSGFISKMEENYFWQNVHYRQDD